MDMKKHRDAFDLWDFLPAILSAHNGKPLPPEPHVPINATEAKAIASKSFATGWAKNFRQRMRVRCFTASFQRFDSGTQRANEHRQQRRRGSREHHPSPGIRSWRRNRQVITPTSA
jgi:hypothetical protein